MQFTVLSTAAVVVGTTIFIGDGGPPPGRLAAEPTVSRPDPEGPARTPGPGLSAWPWIAPVPAQSEPIVGEPIDLRISAARLKKSTTINVSASSEPNTGNPAPPAAPDHGCAGWVALNPLCAWFAELTSLITPGYPEDAPR